MTIRRSRDIVRNDRAAGLLAVEVDNGAESLGVAVREGGRIEVSAAETAWAFVSVDVDPDTARLLGTALLSAARVAERARKA